MVWRGPWYTKWKFSQCTTIQVGQKHTFSFVKVFYIVGNLNKILIKVTTFCVCYLFLKKHVDTTISIRELTMFYVGSTRGWSREKRIFYFWLHFWTLHGNRSILHEQKEKWIFEGTHFCPKFGIFQDLSNNKMSFVMWLVVQFCFVQRTTIPTKALYFLKRGNLMGISLSSSAQDLL